MKVHAGKRRQYRMPDGTYTPYATTMARAWYALSGPLERALKDGGWKAFGFDPGVSFCREDGRTFNLPTDVIELLNAILR